MSNCGYMYHVPALPTLLLVNGLREAVRNVYAAFIYHFDTN